MVIIIIILYNDPELLQLQRLNVKIMSFSGFKSNTRTLIFNTLYITAHNSYDFHGSRIRQYGNIDRITHAEPFSCSLVAAGGGHQKILR